MSYIAPQTDIYLCTNIPLDPNYEETILFENPIQQRDYFRSRAPWVFTEQYYQRRERGWIRLNAPADNVFRANYLMFRNIRNGEGKWFYAFITSCEYINENTCEIKYELDVMQSFMFNYTVEECFVEREHSATDNVGDNLLPENLDCGERVIVQTMKDQRLTQLTIVAAANVGADTEAEVIIPEWGGHTYDGVYSGLYYIPFQDTEEDRQRLKTFVRLMMLDAYMGAQIIAIYYAPAIFVPVQGEYIEDRYLNWNLPKPTTIGNYTPKNNKLLTYPYNYLSVDDNNGKEASYRFEFFSGERAEFMIIGHGHLNPSIIEIPCNYKGTPINYSEMMELRGYPQCSWQSDEFCAWLAQSAITTTISMGFAADEANSYGNEAYTRAWERNKNELPTLQQIRSENAYEAARARSLSESQNRIAHSLATNAVSAFRNRLECQGSTANVAKLQNDLYNFRWYYMQITEEYAKRIDKYFSRFGYTTKAIKVPNQNVRKRWCYTKTVGCQIKSTFPNDYAEAIEAIYDNGITFWKYEPNIDEDIGNYELDNPIETN